jgi:hypothetical protein
MPNVVNLDLPDGVVDFVDDSIVSDPQSVKSLGARKFDRSPRERRITQAFDPFENSAPQRQRKVSEISLDRRFDPDFITSHRPSGASEALRA